MKKTLLLTFCSIFGLTLSAQSIFGYYGEAEEKRAKHRELESKVIRKEGAKYESKQNSSVARSTTCEDYSLYPFIKGNTIAGEFPFDKNGLISSWEGAGQVYHNSSNIAVSGILVYLSNPGLTAVTSTAHLYEVNEDTVGNRLTWKEFEVAPGAQQAAQVYFDNPVTVDGDFMVSFQLISDGTADTVSVALGAGGRGENLGRMYSMMFDYWYEPLNDLGGLDWDFMIFPMFEVDLTADMTVASQAFQGDEVSYSVNTVLPSLADSMINFSYWFGAPQLYLEIVDPNGDTLASEAGTFPGDFTFDNLGVHTFQHSAVWFQWATMFADLQGGDPPAFCFDEAEFDIEIVSPVGLEEIDGLRPAWFPQGSELLFNASVTGTMNVYSVDGRLVETHRLNEATSQVVQERTAGIYIIELVHNDERTVIKVMK